MSRSHTTLIFVRHGQTVWNSQGRWQGWLDSPLTPLGEEQARGVAAQLAAMKFHAVYSSDCGRAMHTAQIICEERNLSPIPEAGLRERYYGDYEGLSSPEIEEKLPGTRFSPARDKRETWRPPGGETMAEVRERLGGFLDRIVPLHKGKSVLNVTHSGVVRALDSIVQQRSFDEIWERVPQNCCIYIVRAFADGRYEVEQDFRVALQETTGR